MYNHILENVFFFINSNQGSPFIWISAYYLPVSWKLQSKFSGLLWYIQSFWSRLTLFYFILIKNGIMWIKSYLRSRKQKVFAECVQKDEQELLTGRFLVHIISSILQTNWKENAFIYRWYFSKLIIVQFSWKRNCTKMILKCFFFCFQNVYHIYVITKSYLHCAYSLFKRNLTFNRRGQQANPNT